MCITRINIVRSLDNLTYTQVKSTTWPTESDEMLAKIDTAEMQPSH